MDSIEERLKKLIIEKYGTFSNFTQEIGMNNSTLTNILNRGVNKASIGNIIKICQALEISADGLADDKIVAVKPQLTKQKHKQSIEDIIAYAKLNISSYSDVTLDGEPITDTERELLLDTLTLALDFARTRHEKLKEKQR